MNRGLDSEGEWHALDGQMLFGNRGVLQVIESKRQELYMSQEAGIVWENGKTPGERRVVGIDQELCDEFSKRSAVINERLRQWVESFKERHGTEPNKKQEGHAKRRIAKATRKAKTEQLEPRSDMIETWAAEAANYDGDFANSYKAATKAAASTEPSAPSSVTGRQLRSTTTPRQSWPRLLSV